MAVCMRPGLACSHTVVGARTQPLDSCMMMARMNSAGIEVAADSRMMLDFIAAVSVASLLRPQLSVWHEVWMVGRLVALGKGG